MLNILLNQLTTTFIPQNFWHNHKIYFNLVKMIIHLFLWRTSEHPSLGLQIIRLSDFRASITWNYMVILGGKCSPFPCSIVLLIIGQDYTPHPCWPQYHSCLQSLCSSSSMRVLQGFWLEHQCERDFLPFSMRRRITSMPPCVLIRLIHPWVLFLLMFLGWYSVPLFPVRTCW